jgi:hypothetical protein
METCGAGMRRSAENCNLQITIKRCVMHGGLWVVIEALCYKIEDRHFEPMRLLNIINLPTHSGRSRWVYLASNRNEYQRQI